jgi:hypothetical protein
MKKKNEPPQPKRAEGPLVIVDLHDRVPGMTDDALNNLHVNATRLAQSGNDRQRASAGALMPVIESELALRHAKALANKPVRKPRAPAKKKAAPVATAAASEAAKEEAAG